MRQMEDLDRLLDELQTLRPDCRPGEHVVAGKASPYNLDLLRSFEAREAVRAAPASLRALTDEALTELFYNGLKRCADAAYCDRDAALVLERCHLERARRELKAYAPDAAA
jgi:hypothetical protein